MKQNRILHIELGAEAADVIGWMRSLPSRTINHTVNEILSSESRGKIRKIPHEFSSAKEDEQLSCGLVIRDRAALNFVAKIPKGEIKSTLVKTIRKHIRKNRELPPAPIGIHGGILIDVLRKFVTKMEAKETEYAGVPNKYSKLCEANDKAYHALRDEILACYKSVDENQGDENLRNLDCDRIIREAFDSVFGVIERPVATVATFSRDENHIPAQPGPAANKNTSIFVTNELQVSPEECLMIGNDVSEDMIAEELGMKVFLLTDCLINKKEADISVYPHGDMDALFRFIDAL